MKRMKQEKEMEREAALKYLAEGIWTMGEIRNGHGCIVPSTKLSFERSGVNRGALLGVP